MNTIENVMRECHLFDGIPDEKYQDVLSCLHAEMKHVSREQILLRIGDDRGRAGVVMDGVLRVTQFSEDGNLLTVDRLSRGRIFGESMVCAMSEDSPTQIDALTNADVLYLDFSPLLLRRDCGCPHRTKVTVNLLREMGENTLFLNRKMRILAQNRLRDKIKLYLQMLPVGPKGERDLKMGRSELADYLRVDRSALSRELGRMQKEGLIILQEKVIYVTDEQFLTD